MTCDSNSSNINVITPPLPPVGGFGIPFSPPQIPLPGFELPAEMVEDLYGLVQQLFALFPSGTFRANTDLNLRTVYDFISNILTQISPYLSLYNFFISLLKLPSCIIDVLCSLLNPFALANSLIKLFKECIPPYLKLFPVLALLIMILSLLLLLLKLIQYIIDTILGIIQQILDNLKVLEDGLALKDPVSVLACANKIAELLCGINNILAILQALIAIFSIIETLAKISLPLICSDGDCCSEPLCPNFIKNTPNGIFTTNGRLIYQSQIGVDIATLLGLTPEQAALFNIPPVRPERWQVLDLNSSPQYKIDQIITPIGDSEDIYYPDELIFTKDTSIKRAAYTADLRLQLDPATFGIADLLGPRFFKIKDCIVVRKPYQGTLLFNNLPNPFVGTGTLSIEGGLVYNDDDTPYMIGADQATLNTFIHFPNIQSSTVSSTDDSIIFNNIEFTWKPNAPALAGYTLTTIGCIPEVAVARETINSLFVNEGVEPVEVKLPKVNANSFLPNLAAATKCVTDAVATLRTDINETTVATFQATVISCLTDLQDQTNQALCNTLVASVSIYQSSVILEPDLQFTTRPIKLIVSLKDASGNPIAGGITNQCAMQLASLLSATATFGTVSDFSYDGYQDFVANLTSPSSGFGTLEVLFQGKVFSTFDSTVPSITENTYPYTFVDAGQDSPVRRDEGDVSRTVGS